MFNQTHKHPEAFTFSRGGMTVAGGLQVQAVADKRSSEKQQEQAANRPRRNKRRWFSRRFRKSAQADSCVPVNQR